MKLLAGALHQDWQPEELAGLIVVKCQCSWQCGKIGGVRKWILSCPGQVWKASVGPTK